MLPSPPIEVQLIDTTISLNKSAMITRRKCTMRGGESMTTDDKDKVNKGATATMVMDGVMVMRQ